MRRLDFKFVPLILAVGLMTFAAFAGGGVGSGGLSNKGNNFGNATVSAGLFSTSTNATGSIGFNSVAAPTTGIGFDADNINFRTAGSLAWQITNGHHLFPGSNGSYDLGASSQRIRTGYAGSLDLSVANGSNLISLTDSTNAKTWTVRNNNDALELRPNSGGAAIVSIANTGTATFNGPVAAGGKSTSGYYAITGGTSLGYFLDSGATYGMYNGATTAVGAIMTGGATNGSTAIGIQTGNKNALSTAGASINCFYSDAVTTQKACINKDGSYGIGAGAGNALDFAPVFHTANKSAQQAFEMGSQALTAGTATVTFNTAFAAAPICFCTDHTAVSVCDVGTINTTSVVLNGTTTDTIDWLCAGQR